MKLKQQLKSKIHLKILKFFHENPTAIDTPRGIAAWINHDLKKVNSALNKLAKLDIIIRHKTSSTVAYTYTRNKNLIKQIGKILKEQS